MFTFAHRCQPAAIILASGEDVLNYLQSQWTVNLSPEGENRVAYGLRLNRKGRVLADAFLLREEEQSFRIVSYECPVNELIELLEENVVADDVEFVDDTEGKEIISLWGRGTDTVCGQLGFSPPNEQCFRHTEVGLVFLGRRTQFPNIEILANDRQLERLNGLLAEVENSGTVRFADTNSLHQARVESGLPSIPMEIGPAELPQEGGLDDGAVDFDKGCYLGQEVMARIQSMGQVQRILIPVRIDAEPPETLPANLFLKDKKVGSLKSYFTRDVDSSGLGMALVRRENLTEIQCSGLSLSLSGSPEVSPI